MSEPEYTESGKIRLDFDDPATLLNRKPKKSILKMKHVSFPAHNSRDLWSRDEYSIFYREFILGRFPRARKTRRF